MAKGLDAKLIYLGDTPLRALRPSRAAAAARGYHQTLVFFVRILDVSKTCLHERSFFRKIPPVILSRIPRVR